MGILHPRKPNSCRNSHHKWHKISRHGDLPPLFLQALDLIDYHAYIINHISSFICSDHLFSRTNGHRWCYSYRTIDNVPTNPKIIWSGLSDVWVWMHPNHHGAAESFLILSRFQRFRCMWKTSENFRSIHSTLCLCFPNFPKTCSCNLQR